MAKFKTIKVVHERCPICEERHDIEERTCMITMRFRGKPVRIEEHYWFCKNSPEAYSEFYSSRMVDENLKEAKRVYESQYGKIPD